MMKWWLGALMVLWCGMSFAAREVMPEEEFAFTLNRLLAQCQFRGMELYLHIDIAPGREEKKRREKEGYDEARLCFEEKLSAAKKEYREAVAKFPHLKDDYRDIYAHWLMAMDDFTIPRDVSYESSRKENFDFAVKKFFARIHAE